MRDDAFDGASQVKCAPPSDVLVILMLDGAGGEPGRQVLKAAASLQGPRPHELTAAIRSL